MKKVLLFILGLASVFTGCRSQKEIVDCAEVMCTENMECISVGVSYGDGKPVVFDSYEVRDVNTGKLRDVVNAGDNSHTYTIASDFDKSEFRNKKVKLMLIGKIGGKVVLKEEYTVTADCCHVALLKSNKILTIKR